MVKKRFRPFWSYDVVKTEQWLSKMHRDGYALSDVYFKRRLFIFERSKESQKDYFITYDKNTESATETFETVCEKSRYKIVRRSKEQEGLVPLHQGFHQKNETLKTISFIFLIIQLIYLMVLSSLLFIVLLSSDTFTLNYEETELFSNISTFLQILVLITLSLTGILAQLWIVYTYFKLRKSNYKLRGFESVKQKEIYTKSLYTKQELKALKKNKQVISKIRLAWMYAPDKLEAWLEKKEAMGFNLIKINKKGNCFYFLKGENRKVKYHIDYQSTKDPEYFSLNKDSGWQLMFTSSNRGKSYNIFKQEYKNAEPNFYSDQETKLKHAKKLAFQHTMFLVPLAIIYGLLLISHITRVSEEEGFFQAILSFNIIIFTLVAFEFMYFGLKSIRYYFRVKKKTLL